jgi:hypothetical protein
MFDQFILELIEFLNKGDYYGFGLHLLKFLITFSGAMAYVVSSLVFVLPICWLILKGVERYVIKDLEVESFFEYVILGVVETILSDYSYFKNFKIHLIVYLCEKYQHSVPNEYKEHKEKIDKEYIDYKEKKEKLYKEDQNSTDN